MMVEVLGVCMCGNSRIFLKVLVFARCIHYLIDIQHLILLFIVSPTRSGDTMDSSSSSSASAPSSASASAEISC